MKKINLKKRASNIFSQLGLMAILVFPFSGLAAVDIFPLIEQKSVSANQIIKVAVILETNGAKINAVEGELVFDASRLKLETVSDENSLVSLWVAKPKISSPGKISFSGIIPGGFSGRGMVFSAVFRSVRAEKSLDSLLKISQLTALLNDGTGRSATVKLVGLQSGADLAKFFSAREKSAGAPENFQPLAVKDRALGDGEYFAIFNTQDKTAGVAYYAVYESSRKINVVKVNKQLPWVVAESPYLLKDQDRASFIYVKAVNYAGQGRIAVISPQFSLLWLSRQWYFWIIIIVVLAALAAAVWRLNKRKNE